MVRRLIVLFLALVAAAGCIKEKHDADWTGLGCPGVRLNLTFTYFSPGDNVNHLTDEVNDIRLYVFDGDGVLAHIFDLSRRDIERGWVDVPLDPDVYTIVAWGSDGGDLLGPDSGFSDAFAEVGMTTLDGFRIHIEHEEGVAPTMFDHLYSGTVRDADGDPAQVTVTDGAPATASIDLLRHTNTLDISILGLQNVVSRAGCPVEVFVTNKHGIHSYDGTMHSDSRTLRHNPHTTEYAETLSGNNALLNIKVLRLMATDVGAADPMTLYVRDAATGTDIIDLPVVETIMKAEDGSGNKIYPGQIDLDREQNFDIEIKFFSATVIVSVNGWKVTELEADVEGGLFDLPFINP